MYILHHNWVNLLYIDEEEVFAFDLANFEKSITGGEIFDKDNIDKTINGNTNDPGLRVNGQFVLSIV
jgi:hypothetical protein